MSSPISEVNNANTRETKAVANDLDGSTSSSAPSIGDDLPVARPENTFSTTITSPVATNTRISVSPQASDESNNVLPYPLRLDRYHIHDIGLEPDAFIHYCRSKQRELMLVDPMDLIDDFIQYWLKDGLDFGVNEECLTHLTKIGQECGNEEALEHYIYEYIEAQITKLMYSPDLETQPDNQWSQTPFPTFDESTLAVASRNLNVYPNRNNVVQRSHGNLNVFDLLASSQNGGDEKIRLYHGSDLGSIKKICQYGINLFASHRLGSDFGPGFYVTDNFDDAVYRAIKQGARNNTLGCTLCFELRQMEFSQFDILDLNESMQDSTDPLEWSNSVRLCRRRFAQYPYILRKDALRGPTCHNAERVRLFETERPLAKLANNRKPIQICVKTTTMAAKLERSILGIYMFRVTSS